MTHHKLTSDRVLRWRLLIEEFHPLIQYLPGPTNVEADALSRLPINEVNNENELHESFLFHPGYDAAQIFPLDFELIATHQINDNELNQRMLDHPDNYNRHPTIILC
ncbi:MAG: hypothetical protein ACREBR_01900 [bacterium]